MRFKLENDTTPKEPDILFWLADINGDIVLRAKREGESPDTTILTVKQNTKTISRSYFVPNNIGLKRNAEGQVLLEGENV